MESKWEINLCDSFWPVGLFRCHAALARMETGDIGDIRICHADLLANVVRIISSFPRLSFDHLETGDIHRLRVRCG